MSLKIEQRLDNYTFTESKPRIYTTGAYLVPMQIFINGKQRCVWVVDEFQDDTFDDEGGVSVNVYAENISSLLNQE